MVFQNAKVFLKKRKERKCRGNSSLFYSIYTTASTFDSW
jgi:hypothetical protein